jgi:hypothetical protein
MPQQNQANMMNQAPPSFNQNPQQGQPILPNPAQNPNAMANAVTLSSGTTT